MNVIVRRPFAAAQDGYTPSVTTLLAANACVDLTKNAGATPLVIAALGGHTPSVAALLASKASIDLADNAGVTPLFAAVQ